MHQLLEISWWFSFAGTALPWWLFCIAASLVGLPLSLRLFRGLGDKGASLSVGVGLIGVWFIAWLLGLQWFSAGSRPALFRLLLLAGACAAVAGGVLVGRRGYGGGAPGLLLFGLAALLGLLGLVHLPHGGFSVWLSLILLACISLGSWAFNPTGLMWRIRQNLVPFLVAQLLFTIAFLFFVNVRSYLPWATFELSLFQAEKWGNYAHLQSVMQARSLPPADVWFNKEPLNYYYGGHLMTATIAKATGTPLRIAFNLGLATTFALTVVMAFGFCLSVVHLTTRRVRLLGGVVWHSGMAWGVFGALAIAMFGNLDPWRQFFTRGVDGSVSQRIEQARTREAEDWKLRTGISPVRYNSILAAGGAGIAEFDRPASIMAEIQRQQNALEIVPTQLRTMAGDSRALIETNFPNGQPRANAPAMVIDSLFSPERRTALSDQTAFNAIALQEEAYRRLDQGDLEFLPGVLEQAAENHRPSTEMLEELKSAFEHAMDAAVNRGEVTRLQGVLAAEDEAARALFEISGIEAASRVNAANGFAQVGRNLLDLKQRAQGKQNRTPAQDKLLAQVDSAIAAMRVSASAILQERLGPPPPITGAPKPEEVRYTWQNFSFVNFWDPSRAIKGTPDGVKEAGTITEFPYFSAILGDHHPHHMALPWTLAALCACLSLLRKASRLCPTEGNLLLRGWPELMAMAFFIGTVFSVNIWDSVVLAPLYGLVILVAMKGKMVSLSWRWVGFAGFVVLVSFVVGLLMNSMPVTTPLFQNAKFFLLAVLVLCFGLPALRFLFAYRHPAAAPLVAIAAAIVLVAAGPFFSIGRAGNSPTPAYTIAIRDVAIFALIAGVAAWWTLRRPQRWESWWYASGAIYAVVGGLALVYTLPFRLFFASPLQPETKMLYSLLPPVLSHELLNATGRFWTVFWRSSPINPFPQELATHLRDFFVHWGIFLFPIMGLAIVRFFRAGRGRSSGFLFMLGCLTFCVIVFTRNYLRFWTGPLPLGLLTLCAAYAIVYRRAAEGPAWIFLVVAFFWTWFVEALHFDDDYAGNYERYNTPFKIYYPLWPIFAAGMLVAVREILGRLRHTERNPARILTAPEFWVLVVLVGVLVPYTMARLLPEQLAMVWFVVAWVLLAPAILVLVFSATDSSRGRIANHLSSSLDRGIAHWPAAIAAIAILFVGMYYPLSATITRTREFFTWPIAGTGESRVAHTRIYTERSLDALRHLSHYPQYRQDYKAMTWAEKNLPRRLTILEHADEAAYAQSSRIGTGSGAYLVLGWKHHEHQWRGRAKTAPDHLKDAYYADSTGAAEPGKTLLADLNPLFRTIYGEYEPLLTEADQQRIRMLGDGQRLVLLRGWFPRARLMELYRLRRIVEQQDLTMNLVMESMLRHVRQMYGRREERLAAPAADRQRTAALMDRYGISHVVVGDLERNAFGQDVESRFRDWGFTVVYDSSTERLPGETEEDLRRPTIILQRPADFTAAGAAAEVAP